VHGHVSREEYRTKSQYKDDIQNYNSPVAFHGCDTWSLTLMEEHRLRVSVNGVLRRMFGPKSDEVTGEWRKLHNEEFNDMYCLPDVFLDDQIKKNLMGGACSTYGREEGYIQHCKSRRMSWVGHVAHMRQRRGTSRVVNQ